MRPCNLSADEHEEEGFVGAATISNSVQLSRLWRGYASSYINFQPLDTDLGRGVSSCSTAADTSYAALWQKLGPAVLRREPAAKPKIRRRAVVLFLDGAALQTAGTGRKRRRSSTSLQPDARDTGNEALSHTLKGLRSTVATSNTCFRWQTTMQPGPMTIHARQITTSRNALCRSNGGGRSVIA